MNVINILKHLDLETVKIYLLDRVRADETKVGNIFKIVGICATVLSVVEFFLHEPLYIGSTNLNAILFGFGIASILYSIFTQREDVEKVVSFNDKIIKTKLSFYLKQAREELDADGAFLCKYHNGDSFGTYPNARFTMIKSESSVGVFDNPTDFYNQPMEIYAEAYNQMGKQGFAVVLVDEATPKMKYLMEGQGIEVLLLVPIRKPISDLNSGMLGVKFNSGNKKITHEDIDWLNDYAQKATGVLKDVEVKKVN